MHLIIESKKMEGIIASKLLTRVYGFVISRLKQIGDVAQLGERSVRNAEAEGSNPFISTNEIKGLPDRQPFVFWPIAQESAAADSELSQHSQTGWIGA